MTYEQKKAVAFFAANAGYCTPPGRMACAKRLALAERAAKANGWEAEWEEDPEGCRHEPRCEGYGALGCVLRDAQNKVLGSLWGICGATREYRRVVEAELASEALAELEATREEKRWEASCAVRGEL